MKALVGRNLTALLTSHALRDAQRMAASVARRLRGGVAVVHYFHQADDPYSHLAAQALEILVRRYRIELAPHLVGAPGAAALPDSARSALWTRRDAARLGRRLGLDAEFDQVPDAQELARAQDALAASIGAGQFAVEASRIGTRLWHGAGRRAAEAVGAGSSARGSAVAATAARMLQEGEARRAALGHYLGATFYFGGEWYWGLGRLHYLEERLRLEGLRRESGAEPIVPLLDVATDQIPADTAGSGSVIDFFCSLRSPYTYLALPRLRQLTQRHGATLRLRPLLPMVMRGLPVPRAKRLYIVRDAKREADRLGMPFGRIADPVGRPAERGLAVLHRAIRDGVGAEFALSFLQGVFAEGVDAGSDAGLHRLAARAGLEPAQVASALADSAWRTEAAANLNELLELGLWGVPSFRVDSNPAIWGQDRLWAVEEDLRRAAASAAAADGVPGSNARGGVRA